VIGAVHPDSPAQGKLLPGDRVLAMDGREVHSFVDIRIGAALADDDVVRFKIERNGKVLDQEVVVETTKDEQSDMRVVNVDPLYTTELVTDGDPVGDLPTLLKGDVITHVDGVPVETNLDIFAIFSRSRGRILRCTVRRPTERAPNGFETVECYQRGALRVLPADLAAEREGDVVDNCHILGLRRRRMVEFTAAGKPAEKAGFQRGDIIAAWGAVLNPTYGEIIESIQGNVGNPIRVMVERAGVETELVVTPRRPFKVFGQAPAEVGLGISLRGEEDKAIVADVAPGTPFAALNMPRGALLVAIDGQPVSNWHEVVEALMASAGRSAAVRYRSGRDEVTGELDVPGSLVNELGLPPGAVVWSVDGEKSVTVEGEEGGAAELPLPNPRALRALLATKVGQTVTVRYSPSPMEAPEEKRFTVRADNIDPWQMRVSYAFDPFAFAPKFEPVDAGGNPFKAVKMGIDVTIYQVWQVYRFLTKLASRSMGTQNVAGPVGIFGMAMEQAKAGYAELMFFLAFLSVNLAVINFLPMPVMDGGLMVFLIIEKIKGKPLSLKAQMISTMVGLAAIILVGLFVTIQDIGRFF
jgi:membrane-associated protease RseP (regulator of RpoE activity)